ncbi:MAG: hypothetical protein QNJ40_06710 [Xanthomonadales bacterium]|nr:hypothetical protein [Xanthomonadales bacterium]
MPERDHEIHGLTPDTTDPEELQLWRDLGQIRQQEPTDTLRRDFYRALSQNRQNASRNPVWWRRIFMQPLVPAAAALFVGVMMGLQLASNDIQDRQIDQLSAQVSALTATVALNMLDADSPGLRLEGIQSLAGAAADDRFTGALLLRARQDTNGAVRRAAIEALGPLLSDPEVARQLTPLLQRDGHVLDQLELADQAMAWGSDGFKRQLLEMARQGELNAQVSEHLLSRVKAQVSI